MEEFSTEAKNVMISVGVFPKPRRDLLVTKWELDSRPTENQINHLTFGIFLKFCL